MVHDANALHAATEWHIASPMQSRSKRLDLARCTPLDATAQILMKTIVVL